MSTTAISQNTPNTKRSRFPMWLKIVTAVVVIVIAVTAVVMIRMNYVPADLNTATTRLTDAGLFEISYTPELEPLAINEMHSWTIHVESADGQPVEDAEITVDGGMPQHGHGLPTAPQVTEYLGNGDYLVEGMKFNMPGWWTLTFNVNDAGQTDAVTFNLTLD
jgi:hypothetical protein